ncbi:MAG: serine hydrolase [Bacteroidales bacterium]|nr:serine hydrolase [Bacteroidales bacterium]
MNTKIILLILLFVQVVINSNAQNPTKKWMKYKTPEEAGWSSEKLEKVSKNSNASSIVLVYDGEIVFTYGEYWRRFKLHSMRKSLLSALYGIHVENGSIDLNKTLEELDIDDKTPLTKQEKKAQIIDLLKARSGVYIPSGQETDEMKKARPKRESYTHGTYWYYNNWDFNVLGTIFNQETKSDIFEEFYYKIALPINMQDFRLIDGTYDYELQYTYHPAYPFKMSGRDMARFGQLYLQKGKWDGKQIIPEDWIKQSTTSWSKTANTKQSYGYLWWIEENFYGSKIFYAAGHGGQIIGVFPKQNAVLVIQADTYTNNFVNDLDGVIENIIVHSKISDPTPNPQYVPLEEPNELPTIKLPETEQKKYIKNFLTGDSVFRITKINNDLILNNYHYFYKFRLLQITKKVFYVEDIDLFLYFEFDENNVPINGTFHKSEATAGLYNLIIEKGIKEGVKQFSKYKHHLRNREELRFLAKNLENKNIETIEILKLNALSFPDYETLKQLKDELSKNFDLKTTAKIFTQISDTLQNDGIKNKKAEWFSQIINSQAFPKNLTEKEIKKYVGEYGPRHIIKKNSSLYYYRGKKGRTFKLFKITDNIFILENNDYFRIQFEEDENGITTKIIGCYFNGSFDETIKTK